MISMSFPFLIFLFGSLCRQSVGTAAHDGTATTTFVTMEPMETVTYSFYGEGMAYDRKKDRLILGSLQLGTLLAVPRVAAPGNNVHYGQTDVTYILSERPAAFNGSNFLGLEMDPLHEDVVWGCVAYGPNPVYGVARVNVTDGATDFFDLSYLANPDTGSHAVLNDLTFSADGEFLFITDTWGYQVLRMVVATGETQAWSSGQKYCTQCLTTQPHFDGPNGIVYVSASASATASSTVDNCPAPLSNNRNENDYLIVALGANSKRLLKVNVSAPGIEPVEIVVRNNAGFVDEMDSIVLSADTRSLFVAGNGVNSVFSLYSSDEWASATVATTANAGCPKFQPSALALVHDEDIVCYCTNGFGPAPYPLTLLPDPQARIQADIGITLTVPNMAAEGMEYDQGVKDRLLVGSSTTGSIRGLPNTRSKAVRLTETDTFTYFVGGGHVPIRATKGLKIDPSNSCWLWIAVNSDPIGVALLDICTAVEATDPLLFLDLSPYANPAFGSSPNDIAVVGADLYVTDFKGGYVWRIGNAATGVASSVSIFLSMNPTQSRPKGIEVVDDILLVSLFDSNVLWRVDLTSGNQRAVQISPPNVYAAADGLRFEKGGNILYVARHNDNSVIALVSCDNWNSSTVANDFNAKCVGISAYRSAKITTLAIANGDLWLFCSDDFGPGPYGFNRIPNISGLVNSGSSPCTAIVSTGSSDQSVSNDRFDASDPFVWSTIVLSAVGLLIAGAYVCYFVLFRKHLADGGGDIPLL